MNVLEFLGIARVGRVVSLLIATSAAAGASGWWAGVEWHKGQRAQADVVDLQADAQALRDAAAELRQNAANAAQDMRTSALRMDLIATNYVETLSGIDQLLDDQQHAFRSALASADAADLLACRLGDFGLRWWTAAATGADADFDAGGAAGADPARADPAVPEAPADPGGRYGGGGAGSGAGDGAPIPPLRRWEGKAGGGRP